jgi:cell wall assembly regulator SMI1
VNESWDTIVDWLGRHTPSELALVRPPATADDLAWAATTVGADLPGELLAWWRRTDGQSGKGHLVPPFYSPYPVRAALRSREIWLSAWNGAVRGTAVDEFAAHLAEADRAPAGSPCKGAWLPSWLPIAGDGGGDDLFVDLRPGPARGCVREFLRDDGAGDRTLWTDVGAMLADVAAGLERDVPVHGYRRWVGDDGALSWDSELSRWVSGGAASVSGVRLRDAYAAFVTEARALPESAVSGGDGSRRADRPAEWPAAWIVAHVARTTELLVATTDAVLAAAPVEQKRSQAVARFTRDWARFAQLREAAEQIAAQVRYDNSDAMDPVTLERYAARGPAALADDIVRRSGQLYDRVDELNWGRPPVVHVHIVDGDTTVVDAVHGWRAVLNAHWLRQLPIRTRQLRALH